MVWSDAVRGFEPRPVQVILCYLFAHRRCGGVWHSRAISTVRAHAAEPDFERSSGRRRECAYVGMLVWIAYQLVASDNGTESHSPRKDAATASVWSAIRTIMIADAVMSLDNMLGVAGAAHGNLVLVVLGLLISVPIMVLGSNIILRLVDRYAFIIYVGAAVLAWTAGEMLTQEPWLEDVVTFHRWVPWAMQVLVVVGVLLAGFLQNRSHAQSSETSRP